MNGTHGTTPAIGMTNNGHTIIAVREAVGVIDDALADWVVN